MPDICEVRAITFPVVGGGSFGYGWMDCRDDCTRFHKGTDVVAAKLQPLVSPVDGVVVRFLDHPRAGVGIVVRDVDGYEYHLYHLNNDLPGTDDGRAGVEWRYGPGITPGVDVVAGQLIGFVGDSGNAEYSQPHVHVEIHRPDGTPINPYWSLKSARRDGLQCATASDVQPDWVNVAGVYVSPTGFRPSDPSNCLPDAAPDATATATDAVALTTTTAASTPTTSPGDHNRSMSDGGGGAGDAAHRR